MRDGAPNEEWDILSQCKVRIGRPAQASAAGRKSCFVLLAAKRLQGAAALSSEDRLLLAVSSCVDIYFVSRELFQARTMSSLKLFGQ